MKRIQDLHAHSERRPGSTCWWWIGKGRPRIHAVCHRRAAAVAMSGPQAAYQIANRAAPPAGTVAYMTCLNPLCVSPAHVAAGTRAQIGAILAAAGVLRGRGDMMKRRASAAKGRAARGIVDSPAHLVLAVRAAPPGESYAATARRLGTTLARVRGIRTGRTKGGV
jgi:hypothetical protein